MTSFQDNILSWYDDNKRDLPWRASKNPYFIWISEVILQQTRVDQGLPYFLRFIEAFPTVRHLSEANEDKVLSLWKGLGYYSRARKLVQAALIISNRPGGFPSTHEELLLLPGIGPYTAAAIASIAFNEPVAAVDGNVARIIARVFHIDSPLQGSTTKKAISSFANEWLSTHRPGDFNQALMDLGSSICTPKSPKCGHCPIAFGCESRAKNLQSTLPVKTPRKPPVQRFLIFHVCLREGKLGLVKLTDSGIWKNLYVFPFEEHPNLEKFQSALLHYTNVLPINSHALSHQKIWYTAVVTPLNTIPENVVWCTQRDLDDYGTPILVSKIIQQFEERGMSLI